MKLNSLKLQNFKGIRQFELDAQGQDIDIFGDNATGKTTLADAFMWLLFDKDSANRKDFEIKTLGPNGEPEHGLDHSVEAILELEDGRHLALKKVFKEKWTKKRGSATAEFTGHTTDYCLDGVPVKKKEYDEKITEIADENIFRLLTDPRYFNEILHWQKRRELLLEVCGDVSDAEVIASKTDLSKLSEILGNRTIEQHRKVIQARRSEINKELERIPVRIDEVNLGLPNIDDVTNPDALPSDIEKLRNELRNKQEELAQAKAGGQVAEKTKDLRMIEAQMMDLKNKHRQALDENIGKKCKEHQKLLSELNAYKINIDAKSRTIQHNESEIKSLEEKVQRLRNEWHVEYARTFEYEQSDTCPTCGQALPAEQLESAREKALADFNRKKAEKLESINVEGKQLASLKSSCEEELNTHRKTIEKYTKDLAELEQKESVMKAEIDNIIQGAKSVETTPEYVRLQKQHEELQEQIGQAQADVSTTVAAIQKVADEISGAIQALEQAKARFEARESGLKRIEELKAEERKLAAEYEELERQLYLTEEFIRTKVRLLEEKINSKFRMARFKLFEVQVNGALAETAETMYNGVPYSNLNNGARLNIGLDIINTLAEHYGFEAPIFVDNAEAVTQLIPTTGQQIRLNVSDQDKKLRIELAEKKEMKEAV
jgi:DNA repair exonuclease SbcCD ATPase subunit